MVCWILPCRSCFLVRDGMPPGTYDGTDDDYWTAIRFREVSPRVERTTRSTDQSLRLGGSDSLTCSSRVRDPGAAVRVTRGTGPATLFPLTTLVTTISLIWIGCAPALTRNAFSS